MKSLRLLLSSLFILLPLMAGAGGDTVRNGGGLVENQFVYLWMNLDFFIRPCTENASSCQLSANEAGALNHIRDMVSRGLEPLVFSDEKPQASSAQPWTRLIATKGGRAIVFKSNLYSDQEAVRAGGALHLPLPYLVAAAGELAAENGDLSWSIGLKLKAFWNRTGHILEGGSVGANKVYLQMMDGDSELSGLWLVSDQAALTNLAPLLEPKLLCPDSNPGRLLRTSNADWTGPAATSGDVTQLEAAASIEYVCGGNLRRAEARATLSFSQGTFAPGQSFVRVFDIHD